MNDPIIIKQDVKTNTASVVIPLPQRADHVKLAVGSFIAGFAERVQALRQGGHIRITVEYLPDNEVQK